MKLEKSSVAIKQCKAEARPASQTWCGLTPSTETVCRQEWFWWEGPEEATAFGSQDVCAHPVTEGPPGLQYTWTAEGRLCPSLTSQLWQEGLMIGGKLHSSSCLYPNKTGLCFDIWPGLWLWLFTPETSCCCYYYYYLNLLNAKESCLARSWTVFELSIESVFLCRVMFTLYYLTSALMWCPVMRHHAHGFCCTFPRIRYAWSFQKAIRDLAQQHFSGHYWSDCVDVRQLNILVFSRNQ